MSNSIEEKETSEKVERKQVLKSKCLHERRRRDQENAYFEELAELISASITDMSALSVKPEKSAILQESLNKIKQLKQEKGSSEAVQQSQVSSSKPSVLGTEVLGPLLLEALDGFLFVVNSQGKIDFVSDNVTEYLQYTQDDLVGKSVYNIIHIGDHGQFNNSLLPMSLGSVIPWPSDSSVPKGRTFNCRMLIKPPCDDDDVEVKQTYVSQYENLQISAISQPGEKFSEGSENSEGLSCLVCIARRLSFNEKTNTMLGIEQFTTKQDKNGKIVSHDTSGIVPGHFTCPDFTGQNIQDFCHVNDVQTLAKHFQEVLKTGSNTSSVYRFKLQDNRYIFVQTRSQLFENGNNGEQGFVMSTHSIIRECDSDVELKGSASTSLMKSIIGQSNNIVTNQRNQNIRGIPNSVSPMAVISAMNQPFLNSVSPSIDEVGENVDPFSSGNNWDFMGELGGFTGNSNSGSASVVSNNNNMNFSTGNVSVSSNMNSWNNIPSQMKISSALQQQQQQQQQMMRNMINMQQQNSEKQRTHPSLSFPRSNSFEAGQKSPSFNSSPSPRSNQFPQPNQRSMHGVMGHPSQRSPGSSMGQNRMSPATSHGYPIQRTPPISSGNQNAPSWGRMQQQHGGQFSAPQTPTSSMMSPPSDPLAALQNIGGGMSPSPRRTAEFSFPDNLRTNHRQGKLSQLLAGNSPVSGHDPLKGTALESLTSSCTSKDRFVGDVTQSPADSMHQSPTPGPGQSPPEKPQSTTNLDDGDSKDIHKNVILKQLLSTDDDEEEETNEAATKEDVEKKEMEKNEAEPKKPPNALLKKLLSDEGVEKKGQGTESTSSSRDRSRQTSGDLLQILLNEEDNARSSPVIATAESTSHENDLFSRQRHQSGPQEPQSTTTTPTTSQPQANNQALSFPPPQEVTPITSSISDMTKKSCSSNIIGDKNLNSFLESLWEKDNPDSLHMKPNNRKRKISGADSVDSTDMDMGISASQQLKVANNFRNKNVLLAQLLSKRTPSETVVNTSRLLVNSDPCDMPQNRLNVQEKGLNLRPNESKKLQVEKKDVGLKENQHDSLQALQNSSHFGSVDNSVKTCNSSVSNNVGVSNMTSGSSLAFNNTSSHSNSNLISQSISQSEQNEYDELQKLLDVGSSKESDLMNNTSMDTSDLMCGNSDPLLAEILKQAADLERDHLIEQGNTMSSLSNDMVKTPELNQVTSNEDLQILSQLDQVLQDPSFSLGSETQVSEDRAAIKRIQNQLMNEDPFPTASNSLGQMANIQSQTPQNNFGMMNSQQGMGSQMGGGMDLQFPHMSNHQQYPQASPNFNHQASRLPNPHAGSLASALQQGSQQQQRPVFNSMASQVRHSLLQQQKLKQLREMEKQQMARQQERQRQLMQRQLGQQFNQRFPRNMDNTAVQPLENLGELLNSGTVPNVTLQRNQIPGPMSPRFGLGIQHQQHPNLSQLIQPGPATPNSQMSPHYNQQPQNQWNMRQQQQQQLQQHQQQTSMQSPISSNVPKTNQLLLNRHRSFSGGTMPNNNQPGHFQFPDQNNSQMGLLHQQQQQTMMAQNRMMRQMSLPPGRGSPRAPASPFGNSPDPLLMSPHSSISPRQNPQTSQVSPPFNHTGSLAGSGLGGHQGMTNPPQSTSFQDFDLLSELESKITKSKSQYVKEELRNICNARSDQKQQQNQQAMLQNLPKPAPPPPTQQSEYSELPYDIIEQINEMQQEQQAKSEYNFDDYKEEDVLKVKRQEAKQIYEQFRLLSEKPDTVVAENPEIKASALFRNQLLNPHTINQIEVGSEDIQRATDQHVQVVTKEPRGNVEDIKPADHSKNSLLQQLLSE